MIKRSTTSIIFLLLILSIPDVLHSQDTQNPGKRSAFTITVGGTSRLDTFYDKGYGAHLGANIYKVNSKRLGWDAQVGVNITGTTNSSETNTAFMAIGGGRYYYVKNEKGASFFVNFLAGFALELETADDYSGVLPDVGYSVGTYYEGKRLITGFAIENTEVLILKLGLKL
ncbi:hypothetical protein [Roseivirga sp.]|uniref:hypothetical protein n=1 Tax=Roseivirga sp. TaxID=1964215 RepID=UPI003B516D33